MFIREFSTPHSLQWCIWHGTRKGRKMLSLWLWPAVSQSWHFPQPSSTGTLLIQQNLNRALKAATNHTQTLMATAPHTSYSGEFYITWKVHTIENGIGKKNVHLFSASLFLLSCGVAATRAFSVDVCSISLPHTLLCAGSLLQSVWVGKDSRSLSVSRS